MGEMGIFKCIYARVLAYIIKHIIINIIYSILLNYKKRKCNLYYNKNSFYCMQFNCFISYCLLNV